MKRRKETHILNTLTSPHGKPRFVGFQVSAMSWTASGGPSYQTEDLDGALAHVREWMEAGFPNVSISRCWEYAELDHPEVAVTA